MKLKARQAEPSGDARCEPHVFAHAKPLFLQEHHPQEPKQAQAFQGWLVPCFRVSSGVLGEKNPQLPCTQTKLDFIAFKVQPAQTVAKVQTVIMLGTF